MAKIARRKIARYLATELHNGADARSLAQTAVAYLIEQKQTNQLELLIRDIEVALAELYGAVSVHITSARPLNEAAQQAILVFVREAEHATSAIIIDEHTDSDLIGGVVVKTPTSIFDSSIRTQLRQLTAATKE